MWDVRYAPPPVERVTYPIAAISGNTPKVPRGMWVAPGTYQVRLTAGGKTLRQAVVVRMDPRVRTSAADLTLQFKLSKSLDAMMRQLAQAKAEVSKTLGGSSGAPAARLQATLTALQQAGASLVTLFESDPAGGRAADGAQEAAVAELLKKAEAALAAYKEGAGQEFSRPTNYPITRLPDYPITS